MLTVLVMTAMLVSSVAIQPSGERQRSGSRDPQKTSASRQSRADKQAEKKAKREQALVPGPGRYLAFDVRSKDYKGTDRYILEVTHPSGERTTQDLRKPKLQRRSIVVPLPTLPAGTYRLVIIAESKAGATRSPALSVDVKGP